jgi:DNA-directed RNA polymerase specialized sigma24 family protein
LLKDLAKELPKYIKRRIKAAEMTSAVKKGKFKIQELLDELYLMVYDRLESLPESTTAMNNWLYQLADELLEKLFRELEFEKNHFQDLERIVETEYQSQKEEYTEDGEEDIIPVEEWDEYQKMPDWYAADDLIFGEDENSLLDDITLKLNQKEIHELIEKELAKYPAFKRTIMDLYLLGQFSVEEIAETKWISVSEVEEIIHEVNQDMKKKLALLI